MPGVLERFRTVLGKLGPTTPAQVVLAQLRDEAACRHSLEQVEDLERGSSLFDESEALQRDVLFEALLQLSERPKVHTEVAWWRFLALLCNALIARKLPLDEAELAMIIRLAANPVALFEVAPGPLLKCITSDTLTDGVLRDALAMYDTAASRHLAPNAYQKLATQLEPLLGRKASSSLAVGGPFSEAVFARLDALPGEQAQRWRKVFQLGFTVNGARPSSRWAEQVRALAMDEEGFVSGARAFLALGPVPDGDRDEYVPETDVPFLRGLVFAIGARQVAALAPDVGAFALACYRKVPLHGPVCPAAGNACLWTLGEVGLDGVGQLGKLKTRVKYAVALRLIEKALTDAAERTGLSPDDLEEIGVPTCELDERSRFEQVVGDVSARIDVEPEGHVALSFVVRGRLQKSALKGTAELKALKARVKDTEAMLVAQRLRLERLFLSDRSWAFSTWSSRFLHHPLLQTFVRRLVWRLADGLTFAGGDAVEARPDDVVTLWHPLDGPTKVELEQQPFRQLGRETFRLSDSELADGLTDRFAGRRIQQRRLAAICRERGWQYHLQGAFDGLGDAVLVLPKWGLTATLGVAPGQFTGTTGMGIYSEVETDGLALDFERGPPPARVLSEVMRDVSLFTLDQTGR
jgi:hypothetical protein